ncbi:uncharacterized protein V6R79_018502 [Siganus canaliculatus]
MCLLPPLCLNDYIYVGAPCMKETWSADEASHEIAVNVEALRALTCTLPLAPACTYRHTSLSRRRNKRMPPKMKRGPEDISRAMRADLPRSRKQYPADTEQNVNPQPL